jgi:hypothetical protein
VNAKTLKDRVRAAKADFVVLHLGDHRLSVRKATLLDALAAVEKPDKVELEVQPLTEEWHLIYPRTWDRGQAVREVKPDEAWKFSYQENGCKTTFRLIDGADNRNSKPRNPTYEAVLVN